MVGVYKPLASNLIKFPLEISAEIKIDPQTPVVAFGQAVAYRLFSTKTYIAEPSTISEEDLGRLEALCMLFGIGLVIFDLNPSSPNFKIRMRAQRFSPDMFTSMSSPTGFGYITTSYSRSYSGERDVAPQGASLANATCLGRARQGYEPC